jgi:hypothetical protein
MLFFIYSIVYGIMYHYDLCFLELFLVCFLSVDSEELPGFGSR